MSTSIIITIDTGSSSIRCTAYALQPPDISPPIQSMNLHHSIPFSCTSSTGHILISQLLPMIDTCVDNVLSLLQSSLSQFDIVGIGFSTFVMNLVGVDEWGVPVDDEMTCSYACNRREAVEECERLKQLSLELLLSLISVYLNVSRMALLD
jgi:ribulose kinase